MNIFQSNIFLSISLSQNFTDILMAAMCIHGVVHGLSQQGVWVSFWTPKPLKSTPQDTQKFLCEIL